MSSLKDKVVLITGASSGIGAGTALYFASLGAKLAVCGRNEENLKKVSEQCIAEGLSTDKIMCILGDLCDESVCQRTVNEVIEQYGRLDVLVNNAGRLIPGSIETMTMQQYDAQMNLNVRSLVVMTQLAIPHLLKTKGNIVNVSSVAGLRAFPGILAYNMTKAAVDQFTRTVALEMAGRGIRVNAVNPGVIVTEVHKRGGMSEQEYEQFLERGKTTHAMGRVGTVEEVSKAIAFLASDDASFVTGVTLSVDGGRAIMCPR